MELSVAIFLIKISIFSVGFHNDNILFLTIDMNYGIFPIRHDLNIVQCPYVYISRIVLKYKFIKSKKESFGNNYTSVLVCVQHQPNQF